MQKFNNVSAPKITVPIQSLRAAPQLIQELVRQRALTLAAEVDPEFLKKLSELVEHELAPQKDNEDYNLDLVSQVIDKAVRVFIEGGQKEIKPGDLIKVQESIIGTLQGNQNKDFKESVSSGDYQVFPFSSTVEAELRSQFILKTNRKDSIKGLLAELETHIGRVMKPEEWAVLKSAISAAEARILQQKLLFPMPLEGNEQGQLRNLTAEEMKTLGLSETLTVDERLDSHDLLTLKELVAIVKGEPVHPLSIGPAFWAKYLPEIKQLAYDGVICKVTNNQLVEMKLVRVPQRGVHYSPVEAALMLYFNHVNFRFEDLPNKPGAIKLVTDKYQADLFKDQTKYWVIVDGCVSIPSSRTPYDYESFAKNDERLPAGEVFLFEAVENQVVQTRTAFIPYDYSRLHPLHQHGTVIFGANDQSFHSCYRDPKDFAHESMDDYKTWWHELVKADGGSEGDAFSPAVVAARLHWFLKDRDGKNSDPTYLFWDENIKAQELVIHSISERTEFTKYWMLKKLPLIDFDYSGKHLQAIRDLCAREAPLNRRWLARQYVVDGAGLTVATQPTFYVALAKKMEKDKFFTNFQMLIRLQNVKALVDGGANYETAVQKIFGKEAAAAPTKPAKKPKPKA